MSELISKDDNGNIWIKNDQGEVFGIVSVLKITDEDGLPYQEDTLTVLEDNGFDLNQDFYNESTYLDLTQENGKAVRIAFCNSDDVQIVEAQ